MKFLVCVCVFSEVSTPLFFYVRNLIKQKRNFFEIFVIKFFFVSV